ncbi:MULTISPECIES: ion channel [Chryseobacterium]|uniref:Inward rectifier potassium channel Kirbac3.1 n=1 Tax=Chryseobacterium salivictor TaxID=2547600 RepID=A0A4P6ZDS7_9FLAO|nr:MULTISPECIES: ion channel [Chryseobacterium]MDQ0475977.1 inward rectifier potassium channel [Chryseobacterium sp. MDT2-18]QBO57688.1 Inward rectifier potassium channel Kirbac3.1 [Chryseobacterium salivictor]
MATLKSKFSHLQSRDDTGFSSNASGRFVHKNGMPNVRRAGLSNPLQKYSWYHTMLDLPSWKFILLLISGYILANLCFATIYYSIGIEHLTGIDESTPLSEFTDVFFFSAQTFTTVGYGRIAPVGFLASMVATFEAFLGLLGFAIATGLFYGRFSRPQAFLKFSKIALIVPYEGSSALMFRMAPYKNNLLTDAQVILTCAIDDTDEHGELKSKFFTLKTVISQINILSLNWTVVHKIDEYSPFFELTKENFETMDVEVFVHLRAFDEVFCNTVVQRTSYSSHHQEIIFAQKFNKMYAPSKRQKTTVLNLDLIDSYTPYSPYSI